MKYARKTLPVLDAKALDGAEGLVEAYVSVFNNVDYMGERILPGFFKDTIDEAITSQKDLPMILWSHDMWSMPLGVTTEAEEVLPYDSRLPAKIRTLGGLRVIGKFNMNVQAAKEAHSSIVFGSLRKYSIGYYVLIDQWNREEGIVDLIKGDWLEWSPVNFAANDETLTVDAKGGPTDRALEHILTLRKAAEFEDNSFRRVVREAAGKSYVVVTGKLRATGSTEEATVRFDADAWSADDARTLCDEHNGRGTFNAAAKGSAVGSDTEGAERLAEHGARVAAQVSAYLSRVEEVAVKRLAEGKAGRVLSEANRTILAGLLPDLASVSDRVQKLLDDTAQSTDDAGKSISSEARKLQAQIASLQTELYADDLMEVAS